MASVSVGLESKERPKNAAFSVLPGRKIVRERRKRKPHGNACYTGYPEAGFLGYLSYIATGKEMAMCNDICIYNLRPSLN